MENITLDTVLNMRDDFKNATKSYVAAKEQGIFPVDVAADLQKFIDHTNSVFANIAKMLVLTAGTKKSEITAEIKSYVDYVKNAEIYLLDFIKEEYDSFLAVNKKGQ